MKGMSRNSLSINQWKELGASIRPNGIDPYLDQIRAKAVFARSSDELVASNKHTGGLVLRKLPNQLGSLAFYLRVGGVCNLPHLFVKLTIAHTLANLPWLLAYKAIGLTQGLLPSSMIPWSSTSLNCRWNSSLSCADTRRGGTFTEHHEVGM